MSVKANLSLVVDRLEALDESELTPAEKAALERKIEALHEDIQEIEDRFAEVDEDEDDGEEEKEDADDGEEG